MENLKENLSEFLNEDKTDVLQDFSAGFSQLMKETLPNLKSLDSKTKRAFEKLAKDFKDGLDELS